MNRKFKNYRKNKRGWKMIKINWKGYQMMNRKIMKMSKKSLN